MATLRLNPCQPRALVLILSPHPVKPSEKTRDHRAHERGACGLPATDDHHAQAVEIRITEPLPAEQRKAVGSGIVSACRFARFLLVRNPDLAKTPTAPGCA
jgi:hypothetical protein